MPYRATPDDAELVTSIITAAFVHDPLWGWALARPDGRVDHHGAFWRVFVDACVANQWTWLTAGGEATSVWVPPGGRELSPADEQKLLSLAKEHLGPRAVIYEGLFHRFDAAHPQGEEHYYLSLLGTHPEHRGHGWGMGLVAHDLELIDAQHAPAYLESSNSANDVRNAALGFEQIGEITHPDWSGRVATMWRPAR